MVLIPSIRRRGGSVIYATEIIDRLAIPKEVWVSKYCLEKIPKHQWMFKTYTNKWQFAWRSVIQIPRIFFYVRKRLKQHQYYALYLPYLHFWHWPLIFLFKRFKKKIILTIHDGILHKGDENWLEQRLNNYAIQQANQVIFLSEFVLQNVKQSIGFSGKSSVIPHGLIIPKGLKNNTRVFPEKFRFLFFGRMNTYKGIPLLIQAVDQINHPAFEGLTIAGKTWNKFTITNTNSKIHVMDRWISEEEISQLFNTHEVLVLPYEEATQSGVASIGIAAAIPIICTEVGGLKQQFEEGEVLFCKPNVESIKKAILDILDDPRQYEKLSEKLFNKQALLSWEKISDQVKKEIYSSV